MPSCLPSASGGSPFPLSSGLEFRLDAMQLAENVVTKNDGGCSDERVYAEGAKQKKQIESSSGFDKPERSFALTDQSTAIWLVEGYPPRAFSRYNTYITCL